MCYAVLGNTNANENSSTIDIFDSQSSSWKLVKGLDYNASNTSAVHFERLIYICGYNNQNVVQFDPSNFKHKIAYEVEGRFSGMKTMLASSGKLIILAASSPRISYVTFDGQHWMNKRSSLDVDLCSFYQKGNYLEHGKDIYYWTNNNEVLRFDTADFYMEQIYKTENN